MKRKYLTFGIIMVTILVITTIVFTFKKSTKDSISTFGQTDEHSSKAANWGAIEQIFNRKGSLNNDVFKVSFPRDDLKVTVEDIPIESGLALTSWIAFKPSNGHTMMMGDLVLLHQELPLVLSQLTKANIEVSAIHNHLTMESPPIIYVHFEGKDDPIKLAEQMKTVLSLTNTPLTPSPTTQNQSRDWSKVENILSRKGNVKGNLITFSISRKETIKDMDGTIIPPFMGVATAINIQAIGQKAVAAGDFVLLADEVYPVQRTLTENGITVTAIHNHMLHESPKLFFLHFWGHGDQENIAKGLKAAIDKTNIIKMK